MNNPRKLLCLCDSPTRQTGFGRVAQNLLSRWLAAGAFSEIDVWGIGYEGWPYDKGKHPFRIFPGQRYEAPNWYHPANLDRFLKILAGGNYSHVWLMQDTFLLSRHEFPADLARVCREGGIKSLLYFPVDSALEPAWMEIVCAVDEAVAYCEYGAGEARRLCKPGEQGHKIHVIPHGVDHSIYYPARVSGEDRARVFVGADGRSMVSPDDFLIVNVNMNQRRKGLIQTLEIFKRIKEIHVGTHGGGVKLYMHMRRANEGEGVDLGVAAAQLGLGNDVLFPPEELWPRGLDEMGLARLYNMADLLLTTSLGEGWGLPITEAMACGTPVAGPRHTSVAEIMDGDRGLLFKTAGLDWMPGDNSRLRPRADVRDAALEIAGAIVMPAHTEQRVQRALDWVRELSWEKIALKWEELF